MSNIINFTYDFIQELFACQYIMTNYAIKVGFIGYVFTKILSKDIKLISKKINMYHLVYYFALIGAFYGFGKGFSKLVSERKLLKRY
ncbi:putative membrane protein [Moumouvirus maliensis]|nr:putative membrane protein [Moumouvirus maliensis]